MLLRELSRLIELPQSVERVRRFLLDLAVRGRLVAQDDAEGTAKVLLDEIDSAPREVPLRALYRGLVAEPVYEEPFEIPPGWAWTRLGRVSDLVQRGKSPTYATADGLPVVSQRCVRWDGLDLSVAKKITPESLAKYEAHRFIRENDLLWNSTGTGTIGRVSRVESTPAELVCDSHVTMVRCSRLHSEYVRIWLRSDHVYGRIEGDASGSTNQVELTLQMALGLPLPLPPFEEQARIVARVDELMALCRDLEELLAHKELVRARLLESVLREALDGQESYGALRN